MKNLYLYMLYMKRRKEEITVSYNDLQNTLDNINRNDYTIVGGDINKRIGSTQIENIM